MPQIGSIRLGGCHCPCAGEVPTLSEHLWSSGEAKVMSVTVEASGVHHIWSRWPVACTGALKAVDGCEELGDGLGCGCGEGRCTSGSGDGGCQPMEGEPPTPRSGERLRAVGVWKLPAWAA